MGRVTVPGETVCREECFSLPEPGRCPGLSHLAPLGPRRSNVLDNPCPGLRPFPAMQKSRQECLRVSPEIFVTGCESRIDLKCSPSIVAVVQ